MLWTKVYINRANHLIVIQQTCGILKIKVKARDTRGHKVSGRYWRHENRQSKEAFPKWWHFLARNYLITFNNERPVKFLCELFVRCFTKDELTAAANSSVPIPELEKSSESTWTELTFLQGTFYKLSFPQNAAPGLFWRIIWTKSKVPLTGSQDGVSEGCEGPASSI